METEQTQEIKYSELKTIERYIWVLLDAYPDAINQTELARRSEVSRAAVSQVRDILIQICDLKSLAYERKLVIKKDGNTALSLFGFIMWNNYPDDLKRFLNSSYMDDIIEESDVYINLIESLSDYNLDNYFYKDDFDWFITFLKNKIIFHGHEIDGNVVYFDIQDDVTKQYFLSNLPINLQFLFTSFNDYSLTFIKEEKDYIKLLEFRDKLYFFIIRNPKLYASLLNEAIEWLEIEEEHDNELMEEASETIFKHILKKIL